MTAKSNASEASMHGPRSLVPGILVLLAFVAPGAWMVFVLPPVPVAKALQLITVAVWLLAMGLGLVRWAAPDRRILHATAVLGGVLAVSYILGGSHFQVAFYDLYANMPLVQWLAFPAVFLLAAGVSVDRSRLESALVALVCFGAVLAGVEALQQILTATPRVFGSTGYSTAALAPLIPLGAVLAMGRTDVMRPVLLAAVGFIALDVAVLAGSAMGAPATIFAALLAVCSLDRAPGTGRSVPAVLRQGAPALAALMVVVMLWAQVPALSGALVNRDSLGRGGPSVTSRLEMWQGAQAMFAERPLFGFGPSGYRVAAVEYLPPEALQYGPDREGSIDPTVYSPQSPHSVLWEAATRLGGAGVVALAALLAAWGLAVRRLCAEREADAALRRGLAAAFLTAVFALSVDPVLFAVGLFAPVAAGLAVAPLDRDDSPPLRAPDGGSRARPALLVASAVVVAVAIWLGAGEWRAATEWSEDTAAMLETRESVLGVIPGHPAVERQALKLRLLLAQDGHEIEAVQRQVDGAPGYIHVFRPNLVSLAAYSLSQAERTGRTDVHWEISLLDRAAERMPPAPALVAERLRAAVIAGDTVAIERVLPDAERWGGPYPFTETYVESAWGALGRD